MQARFAGVGDIAALIRLRLDFFTEDPELTLGADLEAVVVDQLNDYYEAHLGGDFFAALIEDGGEIAAVSFLVISEKPANVRMTTGKTGEILNVFTLPGHRRKGFATAALKLVIGKAREEGLSYLALSASASGRHVYEKLGFTAKASRSYTDMRLNLFPPATP